MFTKKFFITTIEAALVAGLAAFTGALTLTNGLPTVRGLIAASVAGGMAILYSFVKSLGGNQVITAQREQATGAHQAPIPHV